MTAAQIRAMTLDEWMLSRNNGPLPASFIENTEARQIAQQLKDSLADMLEVVEQIARKHGINPRAKPSWLASTIAAILGPPLGWLLLYWIKFKMWRKR